MFFHEFGEDLVLACELGFEVLDLLVLGVVDGLGLAAVVESQVAMLEEFFESAVELGGIDVVLIAQVGDRNLVEEMTLEDGNLIGAIKMTTLLGHEEPPFGLN